ncbi:MAG: hypothetical protein PHF44_02280 [Candidatus Pacebacteria bacterium]|nr:hypothetical protein [Candidatus Paceibacterota bacterium]
MRIRNFRKNFFTTVLILTTIAGILGFWYWEKNNYSKDSLKLEILGKDNANFAEDFDYIVKYKNTGDVRLEDAKLIFEYPKNSIVEGGKPLRQEIPLEDIYPLAENSFTFSAKLIGQEGQALTAKAILSYRPKNLNATFNSETTFTTQMNSVPINFEFDLPSKIEIGKNLTFRINYFSNVDYPLLGLRVTAEYPLGFEFISSKPSSLENIEWEIPPLNRAEGGRIEISGKMQGDVGAQGIFKAKIGMWQDGEFILLKEIAKGIEVIKPSLLITQKINGVQNYIASPGNLLHYEIFFKNLGESTISNLNLVDTLDGDIFDLQTLNAPFGDFTLGDNSIIWDWRKVSQLQYLDPQEESKIEFWIKLKSDLEIPNLNGNLVIKNNVYVSPIREEFTTKVNSKLEISQKGFFQDTIFGNLGQIPPKAGEITTYTINWQAKNYYNSVKNARVKAILPGNVQLTGKISPDNSRLTFDSVSREIVWEIGDLQVGQGVLNPAPSVSFQIEFRPVSSQIGQAPEIIGEARMTGEDSWTGEIILAKSSGINTTLPDDPSINQQGTVR